MSHEVHEQRALFRGQPAWHNLGRVFDINENVTIAEAVDEISAGTSVHKCKTHYEVGGQLFESGLVSIVGQTGSTFTEFGSAHPTWAVYQYDEYAQALNKLSDQYPVMTAAMLSEGRCIFLTLAAGDYMVAGLDHVKEYFLVNLWQVPGRAHYISQTPVRVVCANTLVQGLRASSSTISIPHSVGSISDVEFAVSTIVALDAHKQKTRELFDFMAVSRIHMGQARRVFRAAFPQPDKPKQLQFVEDSGLNSLGDRDLEERVDALAARHADEVDKSNALFEMCIERYHAFNDDHPFLAHTVWAAYQAATEVSDWRKGRQSGRGRNVLFGERAQEKVRALDASVKLILAQ